jgi:hypothetical protein
MSYFGQKLSHDFNTFGRKNGHNFHSFGNKIHNINHGVNKFAEYAIPSLGIATLVNPELAPFTGSFAAGIKATQGITNLGAHFVDDVRSHQKPRNPQLQK